MNKLITSLFTVLALTFVSTSALADPTRGVASDSDLLRPEQVVTYRLMLEPNEVTRFIVRGDGDGDIDCVVYDDNGNEVGRDTDSTDTCVIDVSPYWRATFTFRAVNNGSMSSFYSFRAF
jgi:hypothetical protein